MFNHLEILFRTLSNEKDCSTTIRKITKIRKVVEKEEMKVWNRDAEVRFSSVLPEFCRTQNWTLCSVQEIC